MARGPIMARSASAHDFPVTAASLFRVMTYAPPVTTSNRVTPGLRRAGEHSRLRRMISSSDFSKPCSRAQRAKKPISERSAARVHFTRVRTALAVCIALIPVYPAAAQTAVSTVFSFHYSRTGGFPAGGVVQDSNGNLYGTASAGGGGADDGVVFELSPPSVKGRPWVETVLYRFSGGADGSTPSANLTLDRATGILYGTAQYVSGNLTGVVFQLTPPSAPGGTWGFSVIHGFNGGDGGVPQGELILTPTGALFGTASLGGAHDAGVSFRLQPPIAQSAIWTYTVLHNFNPSTDGGNPVGPIAADAKGNIYGLTTSDGAYGDGTVYELSPGTQKGQAWQFQTLHQFSGPDGSQSFTGLVRRSSDGSLFGGTIFGGSTNLGVVFQLIPPESASGSWIEQTIYTFTGHTDGCNPASVYVTARGSIYGTTSGLNCSTGTLFQLDQPTETNSEWLFNTLASDDSNPVGPLLVGSGGKIYGTDYFGGSSDQGSVYVAAP